MIMRAHRNQLQTSLILFDKVESVLISQIYGVYFIYIIAQLRSLVYIVIYLLNCVWSLNFETYNFSSMGIKTPK